MLTTQSSPPAPQAISWIWMLPVTWLDAGQEAGVVPAGRVELGGDGRDVDELPDLDRGADGQPAAVEGQAHRGLEGAEVGVEVVPLVADHHELAGLVGGDQQRRAELPQQRGEVRRVDGPQRRRVFRLGAVGVRRRRVPGIFGRHQHLRCDKAHLASHHRRSELAARLIRSAHPDRRPGPVGPWRSGDLKAIPTSSLPFSAAPLGTQD